MSDLAPSTKPPLKIRIEQLMQEYGRLALVIYFSIFALVLVGFAIAIRLGLSTYGSAGHINTADTNDTMSTAGTWGAAWVATKLTQPLRIVVTLALTPLVASVIRRLKSNNASRQ